MALRQLRATRVIRTTPHQPTKTHQRMKIASVLRTQAASMVAAFAVFGLASHATHAGDMSKEMKTPAEEALGIHVHGLVNLEVSDHYITPRGLNVENQGVVFQPLVLLFWNLYSNDNAFLNDVTLTTGVWNSIHTKKSGAEPSHWNEIDPIVGLSFKFAKQFTFDAFWSAFQSQTDSYDTSNNLSLKLTWNDTIFGESFSINPYVEYWYEISDKATVVFNPATSDESYYFSIGINPTYKFKSIPLTISLPTFINLVDSDFYQRFDGTSGGSGLAVFSTQLKFQIPLNFIPKGYGAWTFYAGVQYYHLNNDGLLDGNQVLADGSREENLVQFHGGLSIFF